MPPAFWPLRWCSFSVSSSAPFPWTTSFSDAPSAPGEAPRRTSRLPVPKATLKLLPEEAISWFGLLAPAHTAAPIIAKVHEEVVKVAAQADMRERLAQLGLEVALNSPDEI